MAHAVVLLVLDGWGIGERNYKNPIHVADPPRFAALREGFKGGALQSSGIAVGLPWGEEGNSEVGHLTIGAGKVLYQYYPKITMMIRDGTFSKNAVITQTLEDSRARGAPVHLFGLLTS